MQSKFKRVALAIALIGVIMPFGDAEAVTPNNVTIVQGNGPLAVTPGAAYLLTGQFDGTSAVARIIDFEQNGDGDGFSPNPADNSCVVAAGGTSCQVALTAASGTTEAVAWHDADGSDATCEADRTGLCGQATDETAFTAGSIPEPDSTDVIAITTTTPVLSRLDCEPESQTVTTNQNATWTCTTVDQNGNPINLAAATPIDNEAASGYGDPDNGLTGPNVDYNNVATIAAGANTVTFSEFTFLPAANGSNGVAVYCFFLDTDNDTEFNATTPDGGGCAQNQANNSSGGLADVVTVFRGVTPTATPTATPTGTVTPTGTPTATVTPGVGTETGTVFRVSRSGRLRGLRRVTVQDIGPFPASGIAAQAQSGRGGRYTISNLPAGTYTKSAFDRRGRYTCSIGSEGGPTNGTVVINGGQTTVVDIFCER